ncbi:EAL domain-containing protein [Marinobacterium rhizophilum]|uniref:sensor domain-containing protein n=1 Tax=Marinobacterium rhizophilum TaxID=420402 RepID=UPI0009FD4756|nr:EAL domain-containing protein [Marinobacterium rhizophilum]
MSAPWGKGSACVARRRMPYPGTALVWVIALMLWSPASMAASLDDLLQHPVPLLVSLLALLALALLGLCGICYRCWLLQARLREQEAGQQRYHAVFDALPEPACIKNARGQFLDCNRAFVSFTGLSHTALIGKTSSEVFSAADGLRIAEQDRHALRVDGIFRGEDWVHGAGHRPRLVSFLRTRLPAQGSQEPALLVIGSDITAQRQEEVITQLQNMTLDCLLRGLALSLVLERLVKTVERAYPGLLCSIMLLDKDRLLRCTAAPSLPDYFCEAADGIVAAEGAGGCGTAVATATRVIIEDARGHPYFQPFADIIKRANIVACWSEPVFGSQGDVLGTFCLYSADAGGPSSAQIKLLEQTARLVSLAVERSRREEQLRKLSRAVEQSSSMVVITDASGIIEYVNEEFCDVTGYSVEEVLLQRPSLLKSGETDVELYRTMWQTLLAGQDWHGEIRNRRKSGELYWSALSVSPILDEDGSVTHFIGISEDISTQKHSQAQIEQLAFYDPLTQLGNRRLFREQLDQELRKVRRTGQQLAVFYLDLDNFKQINDTLGHDVGDRLLQAIAGLLRVTLRETDNIARLGGDEFIILLPQMTGLAQAKRVAEKLLDTLLEPIAVAGHEVMITFSIGITLAPDDGDTWSVLMKNADLAMYRAKRQGRNNYQFFTREMNEEVMRRAQMEAELRFALDEGHFSLAYQPQWNLLGGLQLVGMEALIRWHHTDRGWISPAEFVPVAEELGLIVPLGNWVIHEACRSGAHLVEQGHEVKVAVNLSLRQFRDPNLLNTVRLALQNSGLEARYLEFEITESMIMDDINRVLEILGALKALGVTLSIDDFGTGYSSLSYLKQLPLDQLKVDASFVRDIPHDVNDMEIAAAVIAMAHKLGLKVVAEGIETPEQLAFLRENRCEMGQGYLLGRPESLESLLRLLDVELTD